MLNPISDKKASINNSRRFKVKFSDVYLAPSQQNNVEFSYADNDCSSNIGKSLSPNAEKRGVCKYYSLETDEEDDFHFEISTINSTQKINDATRADSLSIQNINLNNQNEVLQEELNYQSPHLINIDTGNTAADAEPRITEAIWSPLNSNREQFALSPMINNQDINFGVLHMSWDHSSDISTSLYNEDDDDIYNNDFIHTMINDILDDDVVEDDVFIEDVNDDTHLFNRKNKEVVESNLNLNLETDTVQPGRVYRLHSKLPIPLDLNLKENNLELGKVYNIKRLERRSKTSTGDSNRKKKKKKKRRMFDWFVKKITVAKTSSPNQNASFTEEEGEGES